MSKIEELIEKLCPNGVEFYLLKDLCKSLNKGTLKTTELKENGEYPVINAGRTIYGYYDSFNNDCEAFTFSSRGEYAGFINYFNNKFWAGGLCYPYTSKDEGMVTTKFLYYYLKSKEKYIMETLVEEGSIPALNKGDVEKVKIPVPPLEIQSEIVKILDNFTELTAELTARKQQYEYYRDTLLTFKKPEIKELKLEEFAEIYDGIHSTPEYQSEGIKFVSVENINDLYNTNKYISEEAYKAYKIKPRKNDVFMTRIGSIGVCNVVDRDDDLAYYVSLALIRPDNNVVNSRYLKYIIESGIGKKELDKRTLFHAVPIKINKNDIGKIILPIPSLEVQERIVNVLDNFDAICSDLKIGLPAEIEARKKQYEYYRDLLLTFKNSGAIKYPETSEINSNK